MKFLAFDQVAAEEITSDRFLQSTEFEPGRALGSLLAGIVRTIDLGPKLRITREDDGLFFLGEHHENENLFVIDEVNAQLFHKRLENECLSILQKLSRFAIRHWKHQRFSRTELMIANSTKAVVFPFPISNQTSFRITIEREPDARRLERRSAGTFLLAYKGGITEGGGPSEEAPLSEFRKALKALPTAREEAAKTRISTSCPSVSSMHVTSLDGLSSKLPPQQGFERWLVLLTEKQRIFVTEALTSPHRIEGPAGTGKTLCLILKAISELRNAESQDIEHHALFVAHSEATRRHIEELMDANDDRHYSKRDRFTSFQSIKITTLQELCGELLNTEISETEFLDRDAMESKNVQLLYINEALQEVIREDLSSHRPFLSEQFAGALATDDDWTLSEMFQHEISVVIKGRADEDLDKYRRLPPLQYGLPVSTESDRGFAYIVFNKYQDKLRTSAQFDTDDIVLTATGQLNTPIWRRRRLREGYDSIFVDETHLFNMNELSVFHYLTRSDTSHKIAYSVDRSQSIGDRGWSDASFASAFGPSPGGEEETKTLVKSVFRCAPEIINLAFSITASGATLFTNFDDPLQMASSAFTGEEEQKSSTPGYNEYPTDDEMIKAAFLQADKMASDLAARRHNILVVAFDQILMEQLRNYASNTNKPVEMITQRGDHEVVKRAERSGRFVMGFADYVGGLEFDGVVLVGVDNGRVPPTRNLMSSESSNFLSYSAHSRLYVAITRARYRVEILGAEARGPSHLLKPALANGALIEAE